MFFQQLYQSAAEPMPSVPECATGRVKRKLAVDADITYDESPWFSYGEDMQVSEGVVDAILAEDWCADAPTPTSCLAPASVYGGAGKDG